ncbi:ABC transporter substrate-binding protein, partial [Myxococcota bacterium]|nr:ABC transporter substrate-binding protein [Myxococcota bacterium]
MPSRSSFLHLGRSLAGLAFLFTFAGACLHTPGRETLRIGVSPDTPPMAFLENGELRGIEITLGQMLAKELNRKTQWVQLEWPDLISALKNDQIDIIMSGMSITEERAEEILFTSPYMEIGQLVAIRWSDIQQRSDQRSIKAPGARIGVGKATTGEALVKQRFPDAQTVPFDHTAELIAGLRQG